MLIASIYHPERGRSEQLGWSFRRPSRRTPTLKKCDAAHQAPAQIFYPVWDFSLQILQENAISLVISDHLLSATTGIQLAGEIKRIRPHVPVVLHSGSPIPTMQNVDCFIHKEESVLTFLEIIGGLMNRFHASH